MVVREREEKYMERSELGSGECMNRWTIDIRGKED